MATQAIGSLFVSLGLDSAAFAQGVKVAQTRAQAFAANLSKRLGALGAVPGITRLQAGLSAVGAGIGVAAGAAAGAGVVALGGFSIAAMNAAKELQNLSQLANSTPEEFQKIAYAASQVGVSQEKMSDILKDVNDRVGDFIATGGGPMKDFFERIAPKVGVTAEQFRKLSGPQALQLYVSSLEKANVNQQDFTFFMEAMASDSTALIPILRNGGTAAQEYGARLEALGGVMDNRTVASLAKMKRSMDEVWVVVKGMGMSLGVAFAPVIEALSAAFVTLGMKGGLLRTIFDQIVAVIAFLAQGISGVIFVVSSLVNGIWSIIKAGGEWISNITGISDALGTLLSYTPIGWLNWLVALVKQTGGWGEALALLGDVASGVWSGMVDAAGAVPSGLSAIWSTVTAEFYGMLATLQRAWSEFLRETFATNMNLTFKGPWMDEPVKLLDFSGPITGMADSVDAIAEKYDQLATAAKNSAQVAGAAFSARSAPGLEAAAQALGKLKTTTDEAETALQTFGGAGGGLAAAGDSGSKSKEKLSALEKVMKKLREEAEYLAATFGMSQLQADIWEAQRAAGVEANSVQGQQIAGLMTQIDRMEQLKDATEEWRDSIVSSFSAFITQGGSFKKVLGDIIGKLAEMLAQKAFTSLLGGGTAGGGLFGGVMKILGFANGTNFAPGGLATVHERGGEIMNLPRGTQVIPHDISKRMADRAAGGVLRVELSPDLVGRVLSEAGNNSIQISQLGDIRSSEASRRALPSQISNLTARRD